MYVDVAAVKASGGACLFPGRFWVGKCNVSYVLSLLVWVLSTCIACLSLARIHFLDRPRSNELQR